MQTWKSGNIDQAVSLFDDCDGLWQNAIKVDEELQFNSWLFDGMKTDLKPCGFHVEANQLKVSREYTHVCGLLGL